MTKFFAHTAPDGKSWELLKTHLLNVANRARLFASAFDAGEEGYTAGLLYDLGKDRVGGQKKHIASKKRRFNPEKGRNRQQFLSYSFNSLPSEREGVVVCQKIVINSTLKIFVNRLNIVIYFVAEKCHSHTVCSSKRFKTT